MTIDTHAIRFRVADRVGFGDTDGYGEETQDDRDLIALCDELDAARAAIERVRAYAEHLATLAFGSGTARDILAALDSEATS